MQPRHVPKLQAAASETASLLSSREHQAADTRGATKQEEKGRGSVRLARPWGLEEQGVLRLVPQGRGTTGRGHSIVCVWGSEPCAEQELTSSLKHLQGLVTRPW